MCRSPKSYNLSLDCPPCLVLFKMADKIFNEPAIYLSQRYIPNNVTLKKRLHFMTGASLRLSPGNKKQLRDLQESVTFTCDLSVGVNKNF